jgi:hypothetical protein
MRQRAVSRATWGRADREMKGSTMDVGSGERGIRVTVPSCGCCSASIEEEVGDSLGLPRGSLKFVVPITARLLYDPRVVELGKVTESLNRRGCTISVARVRYGIPLRPLFPPDVWKMRVDQLGKELQGVVFAAINFVSSVILVDYVPALVRPHEILAALMSKRNCRLGSRNLATTTRESIHPDSDNHNGEIVRGGYGGPLPSVGASFSPGCRPSARERNVA